MLDASYKAVPIEADDDILTQTAKVLGRVSAFVYASQELRIMSQETVRKIIGNDKYSKLVVRAFEYLMKGHTPKATTDFIEWNLIEMMPVETKKEK